VAKAKFGPEPHRCRACDSTGATEKPCGFDPQQALRITLDPNGNGVAITKTKHPVIADADDLILQAPQPSHVVSTHNKL
jgi:hypothetical protein